MTNQLETKRRSATRSSLHRPHRGEAVKVGRYKVLLGGTRYFQPEDLREADVLIPLTSVPFKFGSSHRIDVNSSGVGQLQVLPQLEHGREYRVLAAPLVDFGGVPAGWESLLRNQVIPLLQGGRTLLAFCMGSHGRTGTFLASLIALLEPKIVDPIAAARQRHCERSVETTAQAEAVFALKGQSLPERYRQRLHP
jgi:hypothetical protein